MRIKKIVLEINDKEIEFTPEQLKELYNKLSLFFNGNYYIYSPYVSPSPITIFNSDGTDDTKRIKCW